MLKARRSNFSPDVVPEDLKKRSLQGGVVSLGNQAIKFMLQTGSIMVLARLLTPKDFGMVAMVSSMLGFVTLFNDFGLSIATIQKQSISHEELSGLFWINVLFGFFIMALLMLCAPMVSAFYNEPQAMGITMAFGVMAILSSLGSQHSALLQRQMRFGAIAARDIAAMIVGISFGIASALLGLQFWALVVMQAANTAAGTIFLWCKSGWRPGLPRNVKGLRQLVKFGGTLTAANFMAYVNHNFDNILIGKFFGDSAAGFYSRAQGLLNKPLGQVLPPIMRVAFPMFSRLLSDQGKFRKIAIQLTEIVSFGGCLLVTIIFPSADWIVHVVLGSQWVEKTAPIFQMLAIFGLLEPLSWLLGTILVASGKPESMAKWRAVTMAVVVISFLVGLPWGVIGVAAGYTVSGIVTRFWLIFFVGNRIGVSGKAFLSACAPFVLSAAGVSFLMSWCKSVWVPPSALLGFVCFILSGSIFYIGVLACIPSGRDCIQRIYVMGRDAVSGIN